MIRLAIADDHPVVLDGLIKSTAKDPNIQLVGSACDGHQLLQLIAKEKPEVILCDINMPVLSGFDVLKKLQEGNLASRVIILSVHEEKPIIEKTFRMGAHGYLLKSSSSEDILDAIHRVADGKKYFSESVLNITMKAPQSLASAESKRLLLSERETEIIELIVDGLSNAEIGEKLFISKRTVDAHRNNILQKLELKNTAQLVRFALKNGLCD